MNRLALSRERSGPLDVVRHKLLAVAMDETRQHIRLCRVAYRHHPCTSHGTSGVPGPREAQWSAPASPSRPRRSSLRIGAPQMHLHGSRGQVQASRDLAVGCSIRGDLGHASLCRRERARAGACGGPWAPAGQEGSRRAGRAGHLVGRRQPAVEARVPPLGEASGDRLLTGSHRPNCAVPAIASVTGGGAPRRSSSCLSPVTLARSIRDHSFRRRDGMSALPQLQRRARTVPKRRSSSWRRP